MKWFKHLTTSLDDPFIFKLIDQFGGDGYLVYFGTVEIMAREFDVNSPGKCQLSFKFLRKKLQLSAKKVSKILNFCEENEKLFAEIDGDDIQLNCPKLKEMSDEWTQRKLGSVSGEAQKILKHDTDTDTDTDTDIDIDIDKEVDTNIYPKDFDTDISSFIENYADHVLQTMNNKAPSKTNSLLKNSYREVRLLIEKDEFTLDQIKTVMAWAIKDDFWASNVLSLAQLRKKSPRNGLTKFQNILSSYEKDQYLQKTAGLPSHTKNNMIAGKKFIQRMQKELPDDE